MPISSDQLSILRESQLFKAASDAVIQSAADVVDVLSVRAGQRVITKGERGTEMFIILEGRVQVHDDDLVLAYIGAGEVFGEVAALGSGVRNASVTAEVDSLLCRLDQASVQALISREPAAATAIIRMLCDREKSIIGGKTKLAFKSRLMEHDFEIGRRIQAGFLPESIPEVLGWEVGARFFAAREVAGDFYDVFRVRALDRLALVIGDVCDKGLGAALFMTVFRSLIRATTLSGDLSASPAGQGAPPRDAVDRGVEAEVRRSLTSSVTITNNYIAETHGKSNMFASLFLGLLDPVSGSLHYINAGHEAPIVFGPGGVRQRLEPTGPVVGVFPGTSFGVEEAHIAPGEGLLAFTDGVPESVDTQGEQFSDARLASLLGPDRAVQALLEGILETLRSFTTGTRQFDDITLLAVRRAIPPAVTA